MRGCRQRIERGAGRGGGGERDRGNGRDKNMKRKQRGRGGTEGLFCKVARWGVAGEVRLCCVGRNWRRAIWEGEEGEVFRRDENLYLGADEV